MNIKLPRLPAALLLAALGASATFAESETQTPTLEAALRGLQAPPAATGSGDGFSMSEWSNTQNQLGNLQSYLGNEDYANALREVRRRAAEAKSPELKKRWDDLAAALAAEQKRVEDDTVARIEAFTRRAGETALAARKPKDLDSILTEVDQLNQSRYSSSARLQRTYGRLSSVGSFLAEWQDMLALYAEGDTDAVRQKLREFANNNARNRLVTRTQIDQFAADLKIRDVSLADAMARIDPVIQAAATDALAAKKAAAMDPHLEALQTLREERNNYYDQRLRRAYDRIDQAADFFRRWQDFLAAYESGDERDARQELRNLANHTLRYRPIPRSQIIARAGRLADELASVDEDLLANLSWKTLPETRQRVADIQEQSYGRRSTELARIVSELDRLLAARSALDAGKAGLARAALRAGDTTNGSCGASVSNAFALPAPVVALRESWWFDAMPALTGLDQLPPRQKDESAADYASRQLEAALVAGDWPRAYRFAQLHQDILPAGVSACGEREKQFGQNPSASLGKWLLGQKLETAAQPAAAAEAYREALAAGAPPRLEDALIARLRSLGSSALPAAN